MYNKENINPLQNKYYLYEIITPIPFETETFFFWMKIKEISLEKKENTERNYKALFHEGRKQHEYETESHRQKSVYNQSNP